MQTFEFLPADSMQHILRLCCAHVFQNQMDACAVAFTRQTCNVSRTFSRRCQYRFFVFFMTFSHDYKNFNFVGKTNRSRLFDTSIPFVITSLYFSSPDLRCLAVACTRVVIFPFDGSIEVV